MILPLFSAPFPTLICKICQFDVAKIEVEGEIITYIILVDITLRPLGDLELVDTDLDGLTGGIDSRAQRQIGREVVLGIISNLLSTKTEVLGLHDER
jgi:hypothetical protein